MNSKDVRDRYLKFFKEKGHKVIDPAPLVLPNDPTTLFTSSGMQPLVPYLMGKEHPEGKRLVDSQPSIRLQDIEEVGDNRHTTFFEMLGNWSLGDYFKAEQLAWVFEFLTSKEKGLGLDPKRLYVSVFEGDGEVEKDLASIDIWKNIFESVEITAEEAMSPDSIWFHNNGRIFAYSAKKNWWSRSGTPDEMPVGEIGGPDSEIFYDFGEELGLHEQSEWKDEPCHPNCDCGRFLEIGNSVFIQYKKKEDGTLEELPQKNVDFGGGLERLVAATNNDPDVFRTDFFLPLMESFPSYLNKSYGDDPNIDKDLRIIVDHIRAASFLVKNGVTPSNKQQGYILRRLIRRAAVKLRNIAPTINYPAFLHSMTSKIIGIYEGTGYFNYKESHDEIQIPDIIFEEIKKFEITLDRGLKVFESYTSEQLNALNAFTLFQSYGFPLEVIQELYKQKGKEFTEEDKREFEEIFRAHQEKSRKLSAGVFKGGLADSSETVTKLHTATHLLQAALRAVLGDHVIQKGQNITAERSRFDFSHPEKLTDEQLRLVEELINEKIKEDLHVKMEILPKEEAERTTAIHAFNEKYGDKVQIYYIGDNLNSAFSSEYCGGPHISHTGMIGRVTIKKQEKVGSGVMRIYLTLA